jgi:hypothetical protein
MKTTNHTPGPWALLDRAENSRTLLSALIALEKASREVLDTSATHDGLKNCKILVEARIAIEKAGGEWK